MIDQLAGIALLASSVAAGWFHWVNRRSLPKAILALLTAFVLQMLIGLAMVAAVDWIVAGRSLAAVPRSVFADYIPHGILLAVLTFWTWAFARSARS